MGPGLFCVYCRENAVDPGWRPFCSERCKLLDLGDWIDERYRVQEKSESSLPDDSDPDPEDKPNY